MIMVERCISCATVSGAFLPPGGIVFETQNWVVVLRARPVRFPCLPLIILKRHVEDMANLDPEESSSLGQIMQLTSRVLSHVLQPAKVHYGIYAEGVKHIHVHVFPRMPNMPPGNIINLWIGQWMNFLHSLGLKKAYSDEIVATYAQKLRQAYLEFARTEQEMI
jgi:diadenosine tetraphosphate (Ap4A) HIT family hydrolase